MNAAWIFLLIVVVCLAIGLLPILIARFSCPPRATGKEEQGRSCPKCGGHWTSPSRGTLPMPPMVRKTYDASREAIVLTCCWCKYQEYEGCRDVRRVLPGGL